MVFHAAQKAGFCPGAGFFESRGKPRRKNEETPEEPSEAGGDFPPGSRRESAERKAASARQGLKRAAGWFFMLRKKLAFAPARVSLKAGENPEEKMKTPPKNPSEASGDFPPGSRRENAERKAASAKQGLKRAAGWFFMLRKKQAFAPARVSLKAGETPEEKTKKPPKTPPKPAEIFRRGLGGKMPKEKRLQQSRA